MSRGWDCSMDDHAWRAEGVFLVVRDLLRPWRRKIKFKRTGVTTCIECGEKGDQWQTR